MKKTLVAMVCVLGLALLVTNARAANITLAFGDAFYVGLINDGIPSSPTDELGYITNLITLGPGAGNTTIGTETYNRLSSTLSSLPSPIASLGGDSSGSNVWTVGTNDPEYVLGKYDASHAGALVWLVDASIGDTLTLPSGFGSNPAGQPYGLSHIDVFSTTTRVPEAGALLMFGSGLIGLIGYRRMRRMQ